MVARAGAFLEPSGPVYTAPFTATALTTNIQDLFCITASTATRVVIREIRLGQHSEFGDAEAELMSLQILRGSTTPSSGTAITPVNVEGHATAATAVSAVVAPSTTLASTTSATLVIADAWNVSGGWWYKPDIADRITVDAAAILCVRMNAPQDAITLNGTLIFQEVGMP